MKHEMNTTAFNVNVIFIVCDIKLKSAWLYLKEFQVWILSDNIELLLNNLAENIV